MKIVPGFDCNLDYKISPFPQVMPWAKKGGVREMSFILVKFDEHPSSRRDPWGKSPLPVPVFFWSRTHSGLYWSRMYYTGKGRLLL